ncbi:Lipase maturation factor 2 [Cichlidogyrus casuarinus]|uniref:Lipase maturation factor n=1 Tax=Cichlidogyrus casuarinus TaxID=1844966 RepID=A0ABD2QHF0_9PLAT
MYSAAKKPHTSLYEFSIFIFFRFALCLYSRNGILPVDKLPIKDVSKPEEFLVNPNLLGLGHFVGLDKYDLLEIVTVIGSIFALIAVAFESFRTMSTFLVMWLCHFTCYSVGQVFMHFQWDLLLLEAGFLTVLLARGDLILVGLAKHVPNDRIPMTLFKWLLFRLMFASGVVKLTSECPAWWSLKALNYHFETQCLPTPLAIFAHNLPEWFLKLSVVLTFYIEIVGPLFFFLPFKGLRLFSFYSQMLLQVAIILTGNYNFFNLLTITLCYSLLTDADFKKPKPPPVAATNSRQNQGKKKKPQTVDKPVVDQSGCVYMTAISHILSILLLAASLALTVHFFGLQFHDNIILSEIKFNKVQLNWFVHQVVMISSYVAIFMFFYQVYCALKESVSSRGIVRKSYNLLGTLIITILSLAILFASVHVFSASLSPALVKTQPAAFGKVHHELSRYQIVNSYGLFRRMTTKRNEVNIEVSDSEKGPFKTLHLQHKPTALDQWPTVVTPHQPRLDWQMWFAALTKPEQQPWIYSLIHGLLEGRSEVQQLFVDAATKPKFVRATIQEYKFAKLDRMKIPANWWTTTGKPIEYLPPMSLSSPQMKDKLTSMGLLGSRNTAPSKPNQVTALLRDARARIGQPKNLMPLLAVVLLLLLTKLRRN